MSPQTIPDENIPHDFPDYNHFANLLERFRAWPHCRVSAMVGAGFSMNAEPHSGMRSRFPTWTKLSWAMFNEIYPLPPNATCNQVQEHKDQFNQDSALKVASMFCAKFGRERLDSFLLERIPDGEHSPGKLHELLLELPWKDVYTTNYDTLLERTDVLNRSYKTVLRTHDIKEPSPRIIKLHGSFYSESKPVITEEDYRKYKDRFDPFVVSVKNSLMENAFVLIGFSGDDPNFLDWNGWIQDIFSTSRNPVYLVGALSLHDAERSLHESRGITPIDLSPIFEGQPPAAGIHGEALQWFFRNLHQMKPQRPERWLTRGFGNQGVSGVSQENEPETVESLVGSQNTFDEITAIKIIERWRYERKNYPGWLIPTTELRTPLWMATMPRIPSLIKVAQDWSCADQILLYREIIWRFEKSLIPLDISLVDPLENAVDELFRSLNPNFRLQPSDKAARLLNASDTEVQDCWLEVAFALLRDSRESFDEDRWGRFKNKIQQVVSRFPHYDDRFYYEQALWLLWNLQHDRARSLIENWTPSQNSPLAKMWKAGILIELDDQESARTILREALQEARRQSLQPPNPNIKQLSLEGWCTYLLMPVESTLSLYNQFNDPQNQSDGADLNEIREKFLNRWDELKEWDCDPWAHIEYFDKTLSAEPPTVKTTPRIVPDFDLDQYVIERSLIEGPNTRWLPAFSYVRMLEMVGVPPQYSNDTLVNASEWLNPFVSFLSPMLLIRAGNVRALRKCRFMSRTQIASMNPHPADFLNKLAMGALNDNTLFTLNSPFRQLTQESRLETSIEYVSRMSLKLETPDLELAFRTALKFHNLQEVKTHISLNKSCAPWFSRLFNVASDQLLLKWLPDLIRFPLPEETNDNNGEHTRHPAITWPDPMVSFPYYRINATTDTSPTLESKTHEAIEWLLLKAQSSSGKIRQRALMRLVVAFHIGVLTEEHKNRFGNLLWEHTTDNGLPDLPDLILPNLLILPSPPDFDSKAKLKQHLLASTPQKSVSFIENSIRVSAPGELEDRMIGEVSDTSKPIIQLPSELSGEIEWSPIEASQLWKTVYKWWENDKHAIKHVNANPNLTIGFENFARRSIERISMFLARVVLPKMDAADEDEWTTILSFLSETRQDKVFLTPALPYILLHRRDERDMVLETIHTDLLSEHEKAVEAAAKAVCHWAFLDKETLTEPVPPKAVNALINRIVFRRPEGIKTCLSQLTLIINNTPNLLCLNQVNLVVSSLTPWLQATQIPVPENDSNYFAEHERPMLRALLGQLASALSNWLKNKYPQQPEPPEISKLRELFESDPLPEVRRSLDTP